MNTIEQEIIRAAHVVGNHYGIPWIILAAIAIHESNHGKAQSAPFNLCGIKWQKGMWKLSGNPVSTQENFGAGAPVTIKAPFASFFSVEHCIGYLAEKLYFGTPYQEFMNAVDRGEKREKLVGYLKGVYATDPAYDTKLIARMDQIMSDTETLGAMA